MSFVLFLLIIVLYARLWSTVSGYTFGISKCIFAKLIMVGISLFVLYLLIYLDCTYSQTHTCCFKSTYIFIITLYTVYVSDRLIVCCQLSTGKYSMHIHNEDQCQQYLNKTMQKWEKEYTTGTIPFDWHLKGMEGSVGTEHCAYYYGYNVCTLFRNLKEVFSMQGAWHSPNTLPLWFTTRSSVL